MNFEQARADLQVQVLQFLRQTGTLRVDPNAGTLGKAMDRAMPLPYDLEARPGDGEAIRERPLLGQPTDPVPGIPDPRDESDFEDVPDVLPASPPDLPGVP